MLSLFIDRRGWVAATCLLAVVGCAAPAQVTPTVAPAAPTQAPAAASASAQPSAPVASASPRPTAAVAPSVTARPLPSATASAQNAPPLTASRLETLNAANAAFTAGKLADAAALYERVVNTPPGSAEAQAAAVAITDFARFRAIVTLLADGREDEARAQLDALRQQDAASPFTRLADQLYNQYGMVGQLRGACAQIQPEVATQAGPALASLQALGVTNIDATRLCSVP